MATIPRERAYDMFLTGDAYCNAGRMLYAEVGRGGSSPFKYVITANLALGLELYFKCLTVLDNKEPKRDHDLKSHFDALSLGNQNAIRKAHKSYLENDRQRDARLAEIRQNGQNPDEVLDFDSSLNKSAKAFVQSRYPFDPLYETHTYTAGPIEIATRTLIVDLNPAWDDALRGLLARPDMPPILPVR
jgi:hypothetical protein